MGQTIGTKWLGSWVSESDLDIPAEQNISEVDELKAEIAKLRAAITEYEAERNKVMFYIEQAYELMKE